MLSPNDLEILSSVDKIKMNWQSQKNGGKTKIPVLVEDGGRTTPMRHSLSESLQTDQAFSSMEKKMDDEVTTVLNEWDENIERTTFSMRPLPNDDISGRQSVPLQSTLKDTNVKSNGNPWRMSTGSLNYTNPMSPNLSPKTPKLLHMSFESGRPGSRLSIFDTSMESMDEEVRSPLYSICPETGKKMFKLQFDIQGCDKDNVKIKVSGRKLVVFALHKEKESGRKSTTEFCRKLKLPQDVDVKKLQCMLVDGMLQVEAPVFETQRNLSSSSSLLDIQQDIPPKLNVPQVIESNDDKILKLLVEVGPLFKPDDVVVRLQGKEKLVVKAERQETNIHGSMSAQLSREYNLPGPVEPKTLKAGLAYSGVLNVTAKFLDMDDTSSLIGCTYIDGKMHDTL